MSDFNIKTFEPGKNYVIEASAGTGKTYNITNIVQNLVNNGIDLGKILIVTYTEKAAGELKDRIRDILKDTKSDIENASIGTIHSFCQKTIKEFGISAGLPLNLEMSDDDSLESFSLRYVREGEIFKDISKCLDLRLEIGPDNIAGLLSAGTKNYYLKTDNTEDPTVVRLFIPSEIGQIIDIYYKYYLAPDFSSFLSSCPIFEKNYSILEKFDKPVIQSIVHQLEDEFPNDFNFNAKGVRASSYPEDVKSAYEFLKKLKEFDFKSENMKWIASKYLKDFFTKWQSEKELRKEQSFDDMIRYVREEIVNSKKADLKNKLKDKYLYCIVDEFQDTNQKQFDIFKSIFMEDLNHHIIVVGDPKQSIYAFQGADVSVYNKATEEIGTKTGIKCSLNKNYRSTENMVETCNKLFDEYKFDGIDFEHTASLSGEKDGKYYDFTFDDNHEKSFWFAVNKCVDETGAETIGKMKDHEFADIAVQQILKCLEIDIETNKTRLQIKRDKSKPEYSNVRFEDFAILVRVRSELTSIVNALKRCGIPFIRYKDTNLFKGKECAHWIALFEAINATDFTGSNRKLFKKALFTSFFGEPLSEIKLDKYDKDDTEEFNLFIKWKDLYHQRRWEDLIDDILVSSNINVVLGSLSELSSLMVFKQIGNYCIDYLSNGKELIDLIKHLKNLSNGGSDDDENSGIVEKGTSFNAVKIMTLHASKGLQFPVVISVAGFKEKRRNISTYTFHDGADKYLSYFNPDNSEKYGDKKLYSKEELAEAKRLFYVGYTRAQYVLILPYYEKVYNDFLNDTLERVTTKYKDVFKYIVNSGESYKTLKAKTTAILSSSSDKDEDTSTKDKQNGVLKKIIKDIPNISSYSHSYCSLSHSEKVEQEIDDEDGSLIDKEGSDSEGLGEFDKTAIPCGSVSYNQDIEPYILNPKYPKGTVVGNALHEIFEHILFNDYKKDLDIIIQNCFAKNGLQISDETLSETNRMISNVMNAVLPIVHGSKFEEGTFKLSDLDNRNIKTETEFNFNLPDELLRNYFTGFIDLMFVRDGNYYSILDWKSDSLGERLKSYSNLDDLKQHVDDAYSIQRVLYSYCLIKWLAKIFNKDEDHVFNENFGGVYYVFLRGCHEGTGNGIYCQTWDSWNSLKSAFDNISKKLVKGE